MLAHSADAYVLMNIVVFCGQQDYLAYALDSQIIYQLSEMYQFTCVYRTDFFVHFRIGLLSYESHFVSCYETKQSCYENWEHLPSCKDSHPV